MQKLLEKAIKIALIAHEGRLDKTGNPYILHPLRVMNNVDNYDEKILAILHDVIEDSDITIDQLREEGFPDNILEALKLLTHTEGESYEQYIEKLKNNVLAKNIKLADLKDNMDINRLSRINDSDKKRLAKYIKALNYLNS